MEVEKAASIAYAQSTLPIKLGWQPASLAMGYTGLALLFGQLDRCRPDEGWALPAHNCLELAAYECEDLGSGLFAGLAGVAMVTWSLSQNGQGYARLLSSLDRSLLEDLPEQVARVNAESTGMPFAHFDLVSGLTGIATYLLARADQPEHREHLVQILDAIVRLWSQGTDGLPRWHTPSRFVGQDPKHQREYPHGNLNCGLAHGLPGPLAILSLASLAGVTAGPAMHETIDAMAAWLLRNRADDAWGPNWPNVIGIAPADRGLNSSNFILQTAATATHTAWCYGSAGVAHSLHLAGQALGVGNYEEGAREALRAIMRRPHRERGIMSPTFCHGLAGLMHIFSRFSQSAEGHEFAPEVERLFGEIENTFEPGSLLGFRSFEFRGQRIDQPGLLDGTPGVALALLAAGSAISPDWDRIFLLS
jgi:hypothetical protein